MRAKRWFEDVSHAQVQLVVNGAKLQMEMKIEEEMNPSRTSKFKD